MDFTSREGRKRMKRTSCIVVGLALVVSGLVAEGINRKNQHRPKIDGGHSKPVKESVLEDTLDWSNTNEVTWALVVNLPENTLHGVKINLGLHTNGTVVWRYRPEEFKWDSRQSNPPNLRFR